METVPTVRVGQYLIDRLHQLGVGHVFGVPGDFILGFMDELTRSPLSLVNTCDEQGAGFAADAYARIRGLGVVCVTYMVGGLKVTNATGQAYAEESPLVVISGAAGLSERAHRRRLHHTVRGYDDQLEMFKRITVAQAVIDDPDTATREIDRVLAAAQSLSRPVYLELPRDMVNREVPRHHAVPTPPVISDPQAMSAAIDEARTRIRQSRSPVLLLGVEVQRFGLVQPVLQLIEHTGIPVAETTLGKSAIDPQHPNYLGIYAGAMGLEHVRRAVEESDCLIILGSVMSDLETGNFTAQIDPSRTIHAMRGRVAMGYHVYDQIQADDFLRGMAEADLPRVSSDLIPTDDSHPQTEPLDPDTPITTDQLFARLGSAIGEGTIVIADPGDALFAATDLPIQRGTGFLAPAFYASLGFAVPAAIGAGLANPDLRPLVLVGDGAFQMTGTELSTAVRYGLAPVVVVLNNDGYATERFMLDGSFNDILRWDYYKLPELLGTGVGHKVETNGDLERALQAAIAERDQFSILDVRLGRLDVSAPLKRLTTSMAKQAQGTGPE